MATRKKKKKFAVKEFRRWLDALAALVVKTRDDFTCRIHIDAECAGTMPAGDFNCQWAHLKSRSSNNLRWDIINALTACGRCHQWAHANPTAFGVWLKEKYPHIWDYVNMPRDNKTWRQEDYLEIETMLLGKCRDLNVDPLNIAVYWRKKLMRKL